MTTQPEIEIARTSYIGTSTGHNNGYTWVIGPVLVDVSIYTRGPGFRDTFVVEVDGRPLLGGFAEDIRPNGLPDAAEAMRLHSVVDAYNDGWNDYFAGHWRSAEHLGAETPEYRQRYGKGWAAAHRAADRAVDQSREVEHE